MKNVGGMKQGKRQNPKKTPKNSEIAHHNYPPDDSETRILVFSRVGKISDRERKKNSKWLYT